MKNKLIYLLICASFILSACFPRDAALVTPEVKVSESVQPQYALKPLVAAPESSPPELVVNAFFTYLLKDTPDIADDTGAQNLWLSTSLRQQFLETLALNQKLAATNLTAKNEPLTNGTFLNAWDKPSRFKVLSVQRTPYLSLVKIRYDSDAGTNYEGDQRIMTVVLIFEDGAWRVSDIHTHASKFASNDTLLNELQRRQSVSLTAQ